MQIIYMPYLQEMVSSYDLCRVQLRHEVTHVSPIVLCMYMYMCVRRWYYHDNRAHMQDVVQSLHTHKDSLD